MLGTRAALTACRPDESCRRSAGWTPSPSPAAADSWLYLQRHCTTCQRQCVPAQPPAWEGGLPRHRALDRPPARPQRPGHGPGRAGSPPAAQCLRKAPELPDAGASPRGGWPRGSNPAAPGPDPTGPTGRAGRAGTGSWARQSPDRGRPHSHRCWGGPSTGGGRGG